MTFLFLINGYWIALLLNLPLLAFNVKKYVYAMLNSPCLEQFHRRSRAVKPFRSYESLADGLTGLWITHIYSTPLRSSGSSMYTRRYGHSQMNFQARVGADMTSQESFIKLGFHLIMFFFYLYSMIVALIRDESN